MKAFFILAFALLQASNFSAPVVISTPSQNANYPSLGANALGEALIVWQEGTLIKSAYSTNNSAFLASSTLTDAQLATAIPSLSLNQLGTAIVAWTQGGTPTTIKAAIFNSVSESFSSPVTIVTPSAGQAATNVSAVINDSTRAVVTWILTRASPFAQGLQSSFYNGTSFSSPTTFYSLQGTAITPFNLSINQANDLFFSWGPAGDFAISTNGATSWSLGTSDLIGVLASSALGASFKGQVAITEEIAAAFSAQNSTTVPTPTSVDFAFGSGEVVMAMNASDQAVIAWSDPALNSVQASMAQASLTPSFSAPVEISLPSSDITSIAAAISDNGKVVIAWSAKDNATELHGVYCAVANFGESFSAPSLVSTPTSELVDSVRLSLGENQTPIIAWLQSSDGKRLLYVSEGPSPSYVSPPENFTGAVIVNRFFAQTEYVHRLAWNASPSLGVQEYLLYRNGDLIGTYPAGSSFVVDSRGRAINSPDLYSLVAVNIYGVESAEAFVLLP